MCCHLGFGFVFKSLVLVREFRFTNSCFIYTNDAWMCIYVPHVYLALRVQKVSDLLELKLQIITGHHVGFRKIPSALSCWAIFPVPSDFSPLKKKKKKDLVSWDYTLVFMCSSWALYLLNHLTSCLDAKWALCAVKGSCRNTKQWFSSSVHSIPTEWLVGKKYIIFFSSG